MKKTILGLFLVAALASCGGSASSEAEVKDSLAPTVDSLAVEVDSLAVAATDSTVAQIPTGGGSSETTQPIK
jgi:hypothetical protein